MRLFNLDAPNVSEVMDVLSTAAAGLTVPSGERVITSLAYQSPREGLALLGAYTSITDPKVRQAFLDLAIMLGDQTG